jgi:hypothetical protein
MRVPRNVPLFLEGLCRSIVDDQQLPIVLAQGLKAQGIEYARKIARPRVVGTNDNTKVHDLNSV